jgi:multiple sugar transport system ATP-binding protein
MGQLVLSNLKKSFGDLDIIKGVNLDVTEGEFVVFVGPSGCGKSTLLRMIAGPRGRDISGDIIIGGKSVKDLPPVKRGIAMVFQSYALYPHMTVFENIAFPLRVEGLAEDKLKKRVGAAPRCCSLNASAAAAGPRSPAASASASPSAAPSCASPRFFCSTSRCPTSTPRCAPRCESS